LPKPKLYVDSTHHGKIYAYTYGNCRCRKCRDASSYYQRSLKGIDKEGPITPGVDEDKLRTPLPILKALDPEDPRHGSTNGYRIGCRCGLCQAAAVESVRKIRQRGIDDDDPRHGKTSGYEAGCRCDPCKVAKSKANASWRAKNRNRTSSWYNKVEWYDL